jgi:hypothetical protein
MSLTIAFLLLVAAWAWLFVHSLRWLRASELRALRARRLAQRIGR